jgi:hypothetical protein
MIPKFKKWWRRSSWAVITGLVVILGIAYMQTANIPVITPTVDRLSLMVFDNYQRRLVPMRMQRSGFWILMMKRSRGRGSGPGRGPISRG